AQPCRGTSSVEPFHLSGLGARSPAHGAPLPHRRDAPNRAPSRRGGSPRPSPSRRTRKRRATRWPRTGAGSGSWSSRGPSSAPLPGSQNAPRASVELEPEANVTANIADGGTTGALGVVVTALEADAGVGAE